MRAIGGAAVLNRRAHFCLDNCGAWVGAATQPIAAKARSYRWGETSKNQLEQPDHHDQPDQKNNASCTADKLQHVCALLNK